jgi:hypothetical protein
MRPLVTFRRARRGRRLLPRYVLAALGLGLAACGSANPRSAANGPTTTSTAPSTSTSTSTSTTVAPDIGFLTAWGASSVAWNQNHTPDPSRPGGFWPVLPDGRDTYTHLQLLGGRVVGYVLALDPSMAAPDARSRLANDLPLDATVSSDRVLPDCELVVEAGPTITAISPGGLVAELTSTGAGYEAASVSTITVSALGSGQSPSRC